MAVQRAAHSLKSMSASLGALTLASCCQQLETMGKNCDLVTAPEICTRLQGEYGRAIAALTQVRDQALQT
jgi:HPt (histidine-containing phosphotransfer) domain-containing protein